MASPTNNWSTNLPAGFTIPTPLVGGLLGDESFPSPFELGAKLAVADEPPPPGERQPVPRPQQARHSPSPDADPLTQFWNGALSGRAITAMKSTPVKRFILETKPIR